MTNLQFKYVSVLVDVPLGTRTFSYLVPEELKDKIKLGQALLVPFGSKRFIKAYAVGFSNYLEEGIKAKYVKEILDFEPLFDLNYLKMLEWVSNYYYCSLQTVLSTIIPTKFFKAVKPKFETVVSFKTKEGANSRQSAILDVLENKGEIKLSEFLSFARTTRPTVKKLMEQGFLEIKEKEVFRNSTEIFEIYGNSEAERHKLTEEQNEIYEKIRKKQTTEPILIYGVTGSGKTEVYFELIEDTVKQGKNVLFLAPEIALVSQLTKRTLERFGKNSVYIWHSSVSDGEKYDVWQKLKNNEVKILMGARSAVFAPLKNIGLIVIDEEHDSSYKQTMPQPRYNAKLVAQRLAEFWGAKVVLGSATPDIETYYRAQNSGNLFELKQRYNAQGFADVYVVDMRDEKTDGNYGIFSRTLVSNIRNELEKKKQTILLLNRRGFSTYTQCMECGKVVMCENCAIPIIYHNSTNSYKCHYCGREIFNLTECPECGSENLKNFGTGSQKVEIFIRKIFENARIARLDSDSFNKKNEHIKVLNDFKAGKIDILVGTQMIAKGLDNPNVTLVGAINADLGFNLPDYRSAERGFSLLTQVAGRSGRGNFKGKVILQTYNSTFEPLLKAKEQDYKAFYNDEIELREMFDYPPFSKIIRLVFSNPDPIRAEHFACEISTNLKTYVKNLGLSERIIIFDASPCIFERIKGEWRYNVLIKNKLENKGHQTVLEALRLIKVPNGIRMVVDIDPGDIL